MIRQYELLILGKGWCGMQTLFFVLEHLRTAVLKEGKTSSKKRPLRIGIISDDLGLAPPCSLRTTALCARRGAKPYTPIGKLLVQGYECVQQFIDMYHPEGVENISLTSLTTQNSPWSEDIERRFGNAFQRLQQHPHYHTSWSQNGELWGAEEEAYLFDEIRYEKWWKKFITLRIEELNQKDFLKITLDVHSALISDLSAFFEHRGNEQYSGQLMVSAIGAYEHLFMPEKQPEEGISTGSLLCFQNVDWGPKSWALNIHQKHILVYRAHTKELHLTLSSQKGAILYPQSYEMLSAYGQVHKIVTPILLPHHRMPSLEKGILRSGLRHKGKKRKPFWGKTKWPGVYAIGATYKNGLSYSFLGGQELASEIGQKLMEIL